MAEVYVACLDWSPYNHIGYILGVECNVITISKVRMKKDEWIDKEYKDGWITN